MKCKVEIIGLPKDELSPQIQFSKKDFSFAEPISLHYLLSEILKIQDADKVILTNGRYMSPDHILHDGDLIQILPRLDGG